ncbi:MAG: c-type cytochrome domain-containing protein, partial [Planctomycetota bacterium]
MRRFLLSTLIAAGIASSHIELQAQEAVSFRDQVAPIIQEHCVACHCAKRAEGGYRLDTIEQLVKPGDGAASPIVAGKRDQSEWILRMKHADPEFRMPLDSEPISPESIELVSKWVDQGAKLDGISLTEPLWSIIPPRTYPTAPEHYSLAAPITALAFSSDGTQVFSSGYHEVLAWNATDGALVGRFGNQTQRIYSIVPSLDPNQLLVGGGTPGLIGEVRLLNRANNSVEQIIVRGPDVVLDLALRPGSRELAVAMADNTIRIINLENNQQIRQIASHADWVTQIAYSEDGKRLGSASRDKSA